MIKISLINDYLAASIAALTAYLHRRSNPKKVIRYGFFQHYLGTTALSKLREKDERVLAKKDSRLAAD